LSSELETSNYPIQVPLESFDERSVNNLARKRFPQRTNLNRHEVTVLVGSKPGNLQVEAVVPGGIDTERKDSARVKTTMTTHNLERLDQLTTETTLLQRKKFQLQQSSLVSEVTKNLRNEFGRYVKTIPVPGEEDESPGWPCVSIGLLLHLRDRSEIQKIYIILYAIR